MKPIGKKSVNIEIDVAREMAIEKANTGKDIYVLVREAWRAFKQKNLPDRPVRHQAIGVENEGGDILRESPWVHRLIKILNSSYADAIKANLISFEEAIDATAQLEALRARVAALEQRTADAGAPDIDARIADADRKTTETERAADEALRTAQELRRNRPDDTGDTGRNKPAEPQHRKQARGGSKH